MKVLSILQPWAHLIVAGFKPVEWRSWITMYRGPLVIHASKSKSLWEFRKALAICEPLGIRLPYTNEVQYGGMLGTVLMPDCFHVTQAALNSKYYHCRPWLQPHGYGWIVENPKPLPFLPIRGQLGLWNLPPEAAKELGLAADG